MLINKEQTGHSFSPLNCDPESPLYKYPSHMLNHSRSPTFFDEPRFWSQLSDSCESWCLESAMCPSSTSHIDSDSPEVFAAGPIVQETEDAHGMATPWYVIDIFTAVPARFLTLKTSCRAPLSDLSHKGSTGQGAFPSDSYHLCRETSQKLDSTLNGDGDRTQKLAKAVRTILECVGEDPEREGLRATPERYAKAILFFTKGYSENVQSLVNGAVFHESHDELVIVRDIDVSSLCEHHMVPFIGKVLYIRIPHSFLAQYNNQTR